jgi:hypothetical protein
LDVEANNIVNNRVVVDYILDLTSGVAGRIVELLRLSSRCAMRYEFRTPNAALLREAGKEIAADLGVERQVSH